MTQIPLFSIAASFALHKFISDRMVNFLKNPKAIYSLFVQNQQSLELLYQHELAHVSVGVVIPVLKRVYQHSRKADPCANSLLIQ